MAACRYLGFDVTGNSVIRSADPENPTLSSVSDHPLRRYGHSRILEGIYGTPILGEGRDGTGSPGRRVSDLGPGRVGSRVKALTG